MDTVIEYRFERTNMDGFRIDTVVEYRFEKTIVVVGLVNFIVYSVKQNVTLIIPIPAVAPTPPPLPRVVDPPWHLSLSRERSSSLPPGTLFCVHASLLLDNMIEWFN